MFSPGPLDRSEPLEKGQQLLVDGAPGVIRTRDLLLRRQALYPAELRAHKVLADNFDSLSCPSLRR
jgi:hypothetical protein